MKTMLRKVVDLTKAGKNDEAAKILPEVYKSIDMAAKKSIIHPRNAARKKARASKLIAAKK
jgi:ribosomal protein S20